MSMEITEKNFEELVLNNDKPVLVDFWASWCGPCRAVGPVIDQIAEDYKDKVVVGKINVDEQPSLAQHFSVMSIPTLCIFQDGEVVNRMVGARSYEDITAELNQYL